MGIRHVNIQVPHMRKGMVTHRTPYHPAEVGALFVRICTAVRLVLWPCLPHSEWFGAEWAYKPTFQHYRVSSMLSFMVLVHGLSTREQFPAHRGCSPLTMNTWLGVFSPVSPQSQHLPTLTTWEFLTPVDAHVNLCPVVGLEDLLADWACCFTPGDRWYIIGDFCCLPGLVPSWQVFTPKKGQNLLFHSFQHPLLDDHLICSNLEQCWSQSRLGLRNCRPAGTSSGHSWCRLHTLCLILTGDAYVLLILCVWRMQDLPTGCLQLRALPDRLEEITISLDWKTICGSLSWSFIFRLEKQWVVRWIVRTHCVKPYCGSLGCSIVFFYAITVGRHVGHSKKLQNLQLFRLTSCIKMVYTIISDHHICLLHSPIVPDPVLLQGLCIEYSNPCPPHTWHSKQHCLVTPKISSEQQVQVLLVWQRRSPPSDLPCLNLNPIIGHKRQIFILEHQLPVVYHEANHHSPEIPIRKIGGLLRSGSAHRQRLFQCRKQTVSSPINLQIDKTCNVLWVINMVKQITNINAIWSSTQPTSIIFLGTKSGYYTWNTVGRQLRPKRGSFDCLHTWNTVGHHPD